MAKQIQQQTGGDLFEIKTVKPYPTDYNECVDVAKKEQQADAIVAGGGNTLNMLGIWKAQGKTSAGKR